MVSVTEMPVTSFGGNSMQRAHDTPEKADATADSATRLPVGSETKQRTTKQSRPGQRTIRPFRPLPSGRAVVGGLLVVLAALGAFVVTGREVEDKRLPYLVAAAELPPGHVIGPTDVRPELLDLPPALAQTSVHQSAQEDLIGAVVLGPLGAGELIQRSALTPPGAAGQSNSAVEFSFILPEGRTPRSLRPGEHVAMLSTTGRDDNAVTTVVVADAIVTDFVVDDEGFASSGDVVVTLAIEDADDVLEAVNAAQATDVTVLRIPADGTLELPESNLASADAVVEDPVTETDGILETSETDNSETSEVDGDN